MLLRIDDRRKTFIHGLVGIVLLAIASQADAGPVPPCSATGPAVIPPHAEPGGPPTVGIWHDVDLGAEPCLGELRGRFKLVVALAARFEDSRSIERMAARIGAISATKGLRYWSATERRWRALISDAYPLVSPDAETRRGDFTASEVLSGRTLYFAQRDTRSTSVNLYGLTGRAPGRMVVEIVNLTTIRVLIFPLFEPKALRSIHFFDRLEPGVWGYYGISAIRRGSVDGYEKSLVNRAVAAYRYFKGVPADRDPPLAP